MSASGMTVGNDYTFGWYDANTGTTVDLGDVQSVKVTAQKHDIKSMPYNAPPRFAYIPDGYKFAFTITRTTSELEILQTTAQQNFNNGSSSVAGFVNETVKNSDGSISVFQYQGFVFWLSDPVDVSRDKVVTMQAEGYASTKIQLS